MLTQMVELLIQQEPTLLAQRTVDTRRYIMDQWDRTHRAPIDENALAVFLYDETHSSLPEEQKISQKQKNWVSIWTTKPSPPKQTPLHSSPGRWRKIGRRCSSQTAT